MYYPFCPFLSGALYSISTTKTKSVSWLIIVHLHNKMNWFFDSLVKYSINKHVNNVYNSCYSYISNGERDRAQWCGYLGNNLVSRLRAVTINAICSDL